VNIKWHRRARPKCRLGINAGAASPGARSLDVALRQSEWLFRTAFESAAVGRLIAALDGRLVKVNLAFAQMLGYELDELQNTQPAHLTQPDDVAKSVGVMNSLLSAECSSCRFEKRYLHKDGHVVWGDVDTFLLRDDQGEPLHFIVTVQDITKRMAVEADLRTNASLMAVAVENLPLIFYIIGQDGNFRLSIGAGLSGLGLKPHEVVGQSAFEIYKDFPDIIGAIRRALAGESVSFEAHVGQASYLNICSPLLDARGGNAGTAAVALDISERLRTERALRESETSYRTLLLGLPDVVMRFDRDGRHLFVSDNVTSVSDRLSTEYLGKTHHELGFPEDQCQFWEEAIAGVFDAGTPRESEFDFEGKLGRTVFNWRLVPERSSSGEVKSVLSISRDVTGQRRAEADYQLLFREMFDGIALHEIICDEQGTPIDYRFLSINPAFERLTGLTAEMTVGRRVLELMPGTEQHWIETYGKVALTLEPVVFESHAKELGKHFRVTAFAPVRGRFVCIFADITERRRAEEERERLEAQLQQAQKMESVGRLAGGVAHDFNNMLGVILGSVELAAVQVDATSTLHADLVEIRKAAARSAELTEQLLAFARQQTVVTKILDLNENIGSLLRMLERLIGEDIQLTWSPGANLWPLKLDPSQLHQILTNLCVNARDAISGVGTLSIKTENRLVDAEYSEGQARLLPGEYVLLTVSDSGCGMSAETLGHIFEPFYTTKGVGEGTGLGLSMVYGAVSQNGGVVSVSSELGHGTTFSLYFPQYAGQVDVPFDERTHEALVPGRETVLLVEDEPAMLRVVKRVLEGQGYTVLSASTPNAALAIGEDRAGAIDLLVTDVVMPEMNGRELANQLLGVNPRMKLLFMSGYTANVIAPHGVLDQAVDFIQKPFHGNDLIAKIREVLGAAPD